MGFNTENQRSVKVRRTTNLSLAVSGTIQVVPWESVLVDRSGLWASGTPNRITVDKPGMYMISAQVEFAANATGDRELAIRKNGVASDLLKTSLKSSTLANDLALSGCLQLAAGDYIELWANQTSTGALNITATAAKESPSLSVALLHPIPDTSASGVEII
jgi:hypothetical protein